MIDYDFVATNNPVNATAFRVLQSGEHYESIKKINQIRSETPLPTKKWPGDAEGNLTGKKIGRLTVVGYSGSYGNGAVWVVRCSCGFYETRKSKAINNDKNNNDCCQECRQIEYLKRHSAYKDGITN